MMIKKYYNITLRDFNLLERTGQTSQFKTSIIPMFLLKGRLTKEIDKLTELLNSGHNIDNEDEIWKTMSLAKINAIEAAYLGIINSFGLGMEATVLSELMQKKYKRRFRLKLENSKNYIKVIQEYTQINVETIQDLDKVLKDLKFRKDKYNENYAKKPKTETKVYLMSIALGVFSYLNQPIDMDMTVLEFQDLRESAIEKYNQELAKSKK